MNLGAHAGFIIAAYAAVAVVVSALIAWIVADHRAQTRALAEYERAGGVRRGRVP